MLALAIVAAVCALAAPLSADEVVLHDGTVAAGRVVVRAENGSVSLQLADGQVRTFGASEVKELRYAEDGRLRYVRFHSYRAGWSRLEVLSRSFRGADGRLVTLVGAVHIADLSFYRLCQGALDLHDMVLFEGVGAQPIGDLREVTLPTPAERAAELARPRRHAALMPSEMDELDPLTTFQVAMGETLDLSFQKDGIDYSHSWWVPADVTVDELKKLFDDREKSVLSEVWSSAGLRQQAMTNRLLAAGMGEAAASVLTNKPLDIVMKETCAQMLAVQLEVSDGTGARGDKKEGAADGDGAPLPETFMQEVLIQGRNKVVMKKLDEVLSRDDIRSVAIFYGAGHNADLERRLRTRGFDPVRDEWFPAWDMRSGARSIWEALRLSRETKGVPKPAIPAPAAPETPMTPSPAREE